MSVNERRDQRDRPRRLRCALKLVESERTLPLMDTVDGFKAEKNEELTVHVRKALSIGDQTFVKVSSFLFRKNRAER